MSYDIYGNNLASGHCEVHPWVHCEYPCPVCLADYDRDRVKKTNQEKAEQEYADYWHTQQVIYHEIGLCLV